MKIALVHDYLTQKGGAERVFELLCEHFPYADVFTSLYDPKQSIDLGTRPVKTTYLQNLPGACRYFRLLAPLYYGAFQSLDLSDYDLIISSTTSFAKAVKKRQDAKHICFCHNVTRFLWDTKTYLGEYSTFNTFYPLLDKIFQAMRKTDRQMAQRPDLYIANSSTVADRINFHYGKQAMVVNYPIDSSKFTYSEEKDSYCLVSSRMLSYKKIDVTIEAFNQLGWPLKVIGDGPERDRLHQLAGPTVEFLGQVSDAARATLMARAKYVIVSALEDYGLVPVEANASGSPVIAYGAGGVLDTQIPEKTGLFFVPQNAEALKSTLLKAEEIDWHPDKIRDHALSNFSKSVFFEKVDRVIQDFCEQTLPPPQRVPDPLRQ